MHGDKVCKACANCNTGWGLQGTPGQIASLSQEWCVEISMSTRELPISLNCISLDCGESMHLCACAYIYIHVIYKPIDTTDSQHHLSPTGRWYSVPCRSLNRYTEPVVPLPIKVINSERYFGSPVHKQIASHIPSFLRSVPGIFIVLLSRN